MKIPFTQEQLVKKINQLKAEGQVDLSTEEDLSLAIMNLISLEEHFFFTAEKTGKSEYFDLLQQIREIRKTLLARMIDKHEGETWCVAKHLLAASMRLIEVGSKLQGSGKLKEAKDMFDKAYELYQLFWALRLKLIQTADLPKIDDSRSNNRHHLNQSWTKEEILSKLVDCCKE